MRFFVNFITEAEQIANRCYVNKKLLLISISILFLLCFSLMGITFAQLQIGVAQGDKFTYNCRVYFSSDNPQATCPANYAEMNNTEWRLTITDVSGYAVSQSVLIRFNNETEMNYNNGIRLDSGTVWEEGNSIPIILPNLNKNDRLYETAQYQYTMMQTASVNETLVRNYPQGPRELNYVWASANAGLDPSSGKENVAEVYFDRKTGIPVEMYAKIVVSNGVVEGFWGIKESSVWAVPELPSLLLLPLLMIGIPLIIIACKKQVSLFK